MLTRITYTSRVIPSSTFIIWSKKQRDNSEFASSHIEKGKIWKVIHSGWSLCYLIKYHTFRTLVTKKHNTEEKTIWSRVNASGYGKFISFDDKTHCNSPVFVKQENINLKATIKQSNPIQTANAELLNKQEHWFIWFPSFQSFPETDKRINKSKYIDKIYIIREHL